MSTAKGSIFLVTAGMITTFIAALTGLLIARILGPADYGVYNLALALPMAFAHVFLFGLDTVTTREVALSPQRAWSILKTLLIPLIPWLLTVCLIIFLIARALDYRRYIVGLIGFSAVLLAFRSLANLLRAAFRGLQKMHIDALIMLLDSIVGFGLVVGILFVARNSGAKTGIETILLALTIAALSSAAVALILIIRFSKPRTKIRDEHFFDRVFFRHAVRSAIPLGITFTIVGLNLRLDILLLSKFSSEEHVGLYASAFSFVMLSRPVSLLSAAMLPKLAQQYRPLGEGFHTFFESGLRYTLISGGFIGVVITMTAPFLVTLFFGAAYLGSIGVVRVLGMTAILLSTNTYLWHVLIAANRQTQILISAIAALVATIVFAFLLVPRFGILGMAWATVLREIVQGICLSYFVIKITGLSSIRQALVVCLPGLLSFIVVLLPIYNNYTWITPLYVALVSVIPLLVWLFTKGISKDEVGIVKSGVKSFSQRVRSVS